MEEKICPMTGKPCAPNCGWFVPVHNECAMIVICDSLFPMMMSLTGEYPDNPLPRIAENTDSISGSLEKLNVTFENTEFV